MFLKQLKLAGFKSFVEPTVIPMASSLVGIVGPNGCGKSNLIDAVRWVMGESAAKNLRGESMTDVIFNGSTTRKAVGQASVELIFDNSLGRLQGQYAAYQEIAIKRLVTRDGESSYYLNGTRCRKRDIVDLFLGTGAGARSYSIIGQGTIARLVEAKPEELRVYLEEAAGVSKYKERRKETLQRITSTRDNLTRLCDIREELDKQLQRLDKQAKTALRYRRLREEERQIKQTVLGLKYRSYTTQKDQVHREWLALSANFEAQQQLAMEAAQAHTQTKQQWQGMHIELQTQQTACYELKTDLTRLEEHILQQTREKHRLEASAQQLQTDYQKASQQQHLHQEALQTIAFQQSALQEQLKVLEPSFAEQQAAYQAAKTALNHMQEQLNQAEKHGQSLRNEQQVSELKQQHLVSRQQDIQRRVEQIHQTQAQLAAACPQAIEGALEQEKAQYEQTILQWEHELQQCFQELQILSQQSQQAATAQRDAQQYQQQLITQEAALKAVIAAALGKEQCEQNGLALYQNHMRLAECLQVVKPWQQACELVLNHLLQSIVIEDMPSLLQNLLATPDCNAWFVQVKKRSSANSSPPRCLADVIQGDCPNVPIALENILLADTLADALTQLPQLQDNQSVITRDGYWLSQDWVRIATAQDTALQMSILERQAALTELRCQLAEAQTAYEASQTTYETLQAQLKQQQAALDALQTALQDKRDMLRELQAKINYQNALIQQNAQQNTQLLAEKAQLIQDLEEIAENLVHLQIHRETIEAKEAQLKETSLQFKQEADRLKQSVIEQEQSVKTTQESLHAAQVEKERLQFKHHQLQESFQRESYHLSALQERLTQVQGQLQAHEQTDKTLPALLEEKQGLFENAQAHYLQLQQQLQQLEQALHQQQMQQQDAEKQAAQIRENMHQLNLSEQTLLTKISHIEEECAALQMNLLLLLEMLPLDAELETHQAALQKIAQMIQQLGAVNLTAIEEYETESVRKQQLDEQHHDLCEALTLLETAITKIDAETQQRFETTFHEVNTRFKLLFPQLFGGGRAELTLTCDNLLEAGITVIAQPPGKRNTTIHLLSGGEKAMTAAALVFAIFQLNPSPFCMLDEVDAPLDDVNIGRFCDLVKEMSSVVQFMFITHNKTTMALADHLIGVTMREAGVSRIVAVDVEEAVSMCKSI